MIVSPGVAPVPLISGKASSMLEFGTMLPTTVPTSSTPTKAGAAGGVVSTVNGNAVDGGLVLPAGSVAVVVIECGPSINGVVGVNVHEPSG